MAKIMILSVDVTKWHVDVVMGDVMFGVVFLNFIQVPPMVETIRLQQRNSVVILNLIQDLPLLEVRHWLRYIGVAN